MLIYRRMEFLRERFPDVPPEAWPLLREWAALLREWNVKINLVSRKDIDRLEDRHLAHCLAVTRHLRLMHGARVLDVGTGGGLPGLPMAICYPQARFTLVDSVGKKVGVVRDIAGRLGLKNVDAHHCRAEALDRSFDFVTGRAVADMAVFIGWIRSRLRPGRRNSLPNGVLYWRGGELEPEFEALGIRPRLQYDLGAELGDRYFEGKYLLHFDARDLPRARAPAAG